MTEVTIQPMGERRYGVQASEGHERTSHVVSVPEDLLDDLVNGHASLFWPRDLGEIRADSAARTTAALIARAAWPPEDHRGAMVVVAVRQRTRRRSSASPCERQSASTSPTTSTSRTVSSATMIAVVASSGWPRS